MNNTLSKLTNRQLILREAKDYIMIMIGMISYGVGWTVFLLPNDITTGGVPVSLQSSIGLLVFQSSTLISP